MVVSMVLGTGSAHASSFQILGSMDGSDDFAMTSPQQDYGGTTLAPATARISKQIVAFAVDLPPGSVVVRTSERKLYYVLPGGQAMEYPVGVGRDGFTWSGRNHVTRKAEWPNWRPPPVMIKREARKGHFLPEEMPGGPKNPLGARALYIGSTEYRIHGTTQPWSIGRAVSSGCIRMLNEHVIDLYDRVAVGATIVVEQ